MQGHSPVHSLQILKTSNPVDTFSLSRVTTCLKIPQSPGLGLFYVWKKAVSA